MIVINKPSDNGQKSEGPPMNRFVQTGCVFLLVVPLLLTACWPFPDGVGGGCQPHYVYDHITDQGQSLVVTDREQVYNGTPSWQEAHIIEREISCSVHKQQCTISGEACSCLSSEERQKKG